MGLKYSMFIVKMPIEEFARRLQKNAGFTDETELMRRHEQFEKEQWEQMEQIRSGKKKGDLDEILSRKPKDKKLREYEKRLYGREIHGMSVWFRTLPADERFVFGVYTNIPIFQDKFITVLSSLFMDAGLKEWVFTDYHHGPDSGIVHLVRFKDSLELEVFPPRKEEEYDFELYAKRIEEKINYPILTLHEYLSKELNIRWQYHMTRFGKSTEMVRKEFRKP